MSDELDRIRKLLAVTVARGAAPAEEAAARRHAARLLGALGLTEEDVRRSTPAARAVVQTAPPGAWSRFRSQDPCSGCPLIKTRPADCGDCERPRPAGPFGRTE